VRKVDFGPVQLAVNVGDYLIDANVEPRAVHAAGRKVPIDVQLGQCHLHELDTHVLRHLQTAFAKFL